MNFKDIPEILIATFSGIVIFYAPSKYALLTLFVLLIIDNYWGLRASKKKGKKITSSRFNDLFAKVASYFIWILFGLIVSAEFSVSYAVWIACAYPIYSELKSINENQITAGKKGVFKTFEEMYSFLVNLKDKKDKLR